MINSIIMQCVEGSGENLYFSDNTKIEAFKVRNKSAVFFLLTYFKIKLSQFEIFETLNLFTRTNKF